MLLAVTAGLRVSEAIGLKYEDIDFLNKKLTVTRQLGRSLYPENSHIERPALSQEIQLKTARSHRQVELADFVLDEILLERQRYEKRKAEDPAFRIWDISAARKMDAAIIADFIQMLIIGFCNNVNFQDLNGENSVIPMRQFCLIIRSISKQFLSVWDITARISPRKFTCL